MVPAWEATSAHPGISSSFGNLAFEQAGKVGERPRLVECNAHRWLLLAALRVYVYVVCACASPRANRLLTFGSRQQLDPHLFPDATRPHACCPVPWLPNNHG